VLLPGDTYRKPISLSQLFFLPSVTYLLSLRRIMRLSDNSTIRNFSAGAPLGFLLFLVRLWIVSQKEVPRMEGKTMLRLPPFCPLLHSPPALSGLSIQTLARDITWLSLPPIIWTELLYNGTEYWEVCWWRTVTT
jgi:hypothetical protein